MNPYFRKSPFLQFPPVFILFLVLSCAHGPHRGGSEDSRTLLIRKEFLGEGTGKALVVAHRGAWKKAPENSLKAIDDAIELGISIVEVDVQRTLDGIFILMHDETLDRTTTGQGRVDQTHSREIGRLFLKDHLGRVTHHRIPTLEEALRVTRGRALINLDKSYGYFPEMRHLLERLGVLSEIILKTSGKSVGEVEEFFGDPWPGLLFMPVLYLDDEGVEDRLLGFLGHKDVSAIEIVYKVEDERFFKILDRIAKSGKNVWVNTLWSHQNAGRDDQRALREPEESYGWLLDRGVRILQTDEPEHMLKYLKERDLLFSAD